MKLDDIKSVDIAEQGCKLMCRYDNLNCRRLLMLTRYFKSTTPNYGEGPLFCSPFNDFC